MKTISLMIPCALFLVEYSVACSEMHQLNSDSEMHQLNSD